MSTLLVTKGQRLVRTPVPEVPESQEPCVIAAQPRRVQRWRRQLRYGALGLRTSCRFLDSDAVKRFIDITGSVVLLVVLMPLLAVTAVLIKLTDFGAVLFWQKRAGRWGREFMMPKFRSMVPNAEDLLPALRGRNDHRCGVRFKMKDDCA